MRTLLLADDSITVQRVIALTFASEPIRIVAVADGQQAMEKLVAERPDIVLAGSTLPFVLRLAKLDPATASAPFVATLVDVTGLIIYFTISGVVLRGTLL